MKIETHTKHGYLIDIDEDSGIFISKKSFGGSLCMALGTGTLEDDDGEALKLSQTMFTYLEKLAERLTENDQY